MFARKTPLLGALLACCLLMIAHHATAHTLQQHAHIVRPHNDSEAARFLSYMDGPVQGPLITRSRPSPDTYNLQREIFFGHEKARALGASLELSAREELANQKIMAIKMAEYEEGLVTPHLFKPSQHIFTVLEQIRASPLFEFISAMPKGAVLHAHDTALCSTEFLVQLTYRENLWVCQSQSDGIEAFALEFARQAPTTVVPGGKCGWLRLSELRDQHGNDAVDDYLRERFSLYPTQKFQDVNAAWVEFSNIFSLLDGLLFYAPVWADYYYNALKEFNADGVQYLEFRSTLPILYDLEGTQFTPLDTVRIYQETLQRFMAEHKDFIGSRLIYAPLRHVDDAQLTKYIAICVEVKEKYPDFVAGFDLVGQEELGRPLKDFIPQLLAMPDNIDFYFHAGETNWYGSSVDENVIDAVLLGTKRIGHGFALVKHPLVLKMLKEHNIAVEVNPVSNQVLQLITDYRNHPCSQFFADNYPVVISSDDPSFWKATPLSHDFYIAFLGIASAHADLRLLKQLAINSLDYSSLNAAQTTAAKEKWQHRWDAYIAQVLGDGGDDSADTRQLD